MRCTTPINFQLLIIYEWLHFLWFFVFEESVLLWQFKKYSVLKCRNCCSFLNPGPAFHRMIKLDIFKYHSGTNNYMSTHGELKIPIANYPCMMVHPSQSNLRTDLGGFPLSGNWAGVQILRFHPKGEQFPYKHLKIIKFGFLCLPVNCSISLCNFESRESVASLSLKADIVSKKWCSCCQWTAPPTTEIASF